MLHCDTRHDLIQLDQIMSKSADHGLRAMQKRLAVGSRTEPTLIDGGRITQRMRSEVGEKFTGVKRDCRGSGRLEYLAHVFECLAPVPKKWQPVFRQGHAPSQIIESAS
jgi:hypothetical protein